MPKSHNNESISDQPSESQNNSDEANHSLTSTIEYHPVRKLIFFQIKLALDAIRDILLSPISIVATLLDLVQGRKGKDSSG